MRAQNFSVVWAVRLGCTTPSRLASEWRIPAKRAADILRRAHLARLLARVRRGEYRVKGDE